MCQPKYKVGDLVTVRGLSESIDKTVIVSFGLCKPGAVLNFVDGSMGRYAGRPVYIYGVDESSNYFVETCVFPYQQPGDDFESIMNQAKNPSTITAPVPEPA